MTARLVASPAARDLRGTGVRRVAMGPKRAAIHPGIGNGIDDLVTRAAEELRGDGGGRDADEQYVVEADAVETVFERENALDFVSLDHRGEDVAHGEGFLAGGFAAAFSRSGDVSGLFSLSPGERRRTGATAAQWLFASRCFAPAFHSSVGEGEGSACGDLAAQVISDAEDGAEVVGGMAPFGGEPSVVEIEPADDATDVEGRGDGVEFEACARDARAVVDGHAGDGRSEQFGARGIVQRP